MGKFKEHGVLLYLSNELYVGFVKLQADKGLGRSFAGLLPFVEGLYSMGYISEEVYKRHQKRYSQPLVKDKKLPDFTENQADALNKTLGMVVAQWSEHPKKEWRTRWIQTAMQHSDLPNAKRLLILTERKEVVK